MNDRSPNKKYKIKKQKHQIYQSPFGIAADSVVSRSAALVARLPSDLEAWCIQSA